MAKKEGDEITLYEAKFDDDYGSGWPAASSFFILPCWEIVLLQTRGWCCKVDSRFQPDDLRKAWNILIDIASAPFRTS